MVKFFVANPEQSMAIQNRVVCDVTEFRVANEECGEFVAWRGFRQ